MSKLGCWSGGMVVVKSFSCVAPRRGPLRCARFRGLKRDYLHGVAPRRRTQEQPSRLRRPSTSTPPLQPLQDSSLPFLLGTQRLTRRILRPAIIDPLVFPQHSMTPPLHVSRTPVSCTHFDDKPYDPPSLGSYGAPSKVEDKVLGDVHGSMANVTGWHG